jgi:hypothetical protein
VLATSRRCAATLAAALAAAVGLAVPGTTLSQPVYSITAANACNSCHIEPSGWQNPDRKADRRCSLSCASCHVSPTGGGMRTPAGLFYGTEFLPAFGRGPSDGTEAAKYLQPGAPTTGRFRLGQGFSGWWPGGIPADQVPDRYGSINPDPTFRAGGDARAMAYVPTGFPAEFFPMQAELYLFAEPRDAWWLYGDAGLRSSQSDLNLLDFAPVDDVLSYTRVRELFAMRNDLPGNSYVRIGRFAPPYGWRLPDHTSYVRRDLGFDQDRQVFGVEGGWNPNYPYVNAAAYYQGVAGWPGDSGDPGYGVAATAGIRELAWQAGGSVDALALTGGGSQLRAGPQWALNAWPVAYLGEVDVRRDSGSASATGLYAYDEIRWFAPYGLQPRLKWDWMDPGLSLADDHQNRLSAGLQVDPVDYLQIDLQYRATMVGSDPSLATDFLAQVHGWF